MSLYTWGRECLIMYYIVFMIGAVSLFTEENKYLFWSYLAILTAVASFRFGVGADYFSYKYVYSLFLSNPFLEITQGVTTQEPLYTFIGSLSKTVGIPYQLFMIFITIPILYYVGKLALEYSVKPTITLFIYYTFFYMVWAMSGIRQGLTISVGMYYLLTCYEKKENKKFIAIVLLLAGIHLSALVLLVLYLLTSLDWNKKKLTILSIISLLISFLPLQKILFAFGNIPFLNQLLEYIDLSNPSLNFIDFQSLMRIVFLLFGLVFYDFFVALDKRNIVIVNTYILGLNLYFVLKSSELVAARMSVYSYYLIILILPMLYQLVRNKKEILILSTSLLFFAFAYLQKDLSAMIKQAEVETSYQYYVPYTNIFNKYEDYHFENRYEELLKQQQLENS